MKFPKVKAYLACLRKQPASPIEIRIAAIANWSKTVVPNFLQRSLHFIRYWSSAMSGPKIISALAGSFVVAYVFDHIISDKKIFGGTIPHTVSEKAWWEETDKKFQAWPRTAGPPVVMNPISRQNFIVKSADN
ncbi:PREDICTED: uncharacterized protein LOC109151111 [Ipomoea nil]|uniref:uncharacterized protein LOC109151111 n=1 Tax=Ipomoea nil TaxID=35883 RepID=UPI0009009178|nr:PREDICTED: uncharacterized protein LOC109151111 [Ipomoea nil]